MALLAAALLLVPLAACDSSGTAEDPSPSPSARGSGLGAVLIVVPDQGVDDPEFWQLYDLLAAAGYIPVVASPSGTEIVGSEGTTVKTDLKTADADARDYVGLVIMGESEATPDDPALRTLVRSAVAADTVVGRSWGEGLQTIVVEGKALPNDSPLLTLDFASTFTDILSMALYGVTALPSDESPSP
jgi:hypothetical protein